MIRQFQRVDRGGEHIPSNSLINNKVMSNKEYFLIASYFTTYYILFLFIMCLKH